MKAHPRPPRPRGRRARQGCAAFVESLERRKLLAAVSWDGGGDGVNWTDPLNWSADALPGTADDVTIDAADNVEVRGPATQQVHSLDCNAPLTIDGGGVLSLGSDSTIHQLFTLASGELTGDGNVTLRGAFAWSGGGMTGTGRTVLLAQMTLSGESHLLDRPLDNSAGTVRWQAGALTIGGGGSFNNAGSLRLEGAAGTTYSVVPGGPGAGAGTFNNLLLPTRGSIQVPAGGFLRVATSGTNAGTFALDPGARLEFDADYTHAASGRIDGTAFLVFAGGAQTFPADVTLGIESIEVQAAATIAGAGTFTVAHEVSSLGAAWSGTGRLVVAGGGVLNLAAVAPTKNAFVRSVDNNGGGTVVWKSGELALRPGMSFNNYGVLDLHGPDFATYRLTSVGAATFRNLVNTDTGAAGKINIPQASTLQLEAPFYNNAAINLAPVARLSIENDFTYGPAGTIKGPGSVVLSAGVQTLVSNTVFGVNFIEFTGGTITGPGNFVVGGVGLSTSLNWTGGDWGGTGHITVTSGGTFNLPTTRARLDIAQTVDNAGRIVWTSGELAMAAGVAFNNNGLIVLAGPAGSTYLITAAAGGSFNNASSLNGNLAVANGSTLLIAAPGRNAGRLFSSPGGLVVFDADITHDSGESFGDSNNGSSFGSVTLAGGTQTYTGNVTFTGVTVNFTGGEIAGAGILSINTKFNWAGAGTWSGTGRTIVQSGGTLTLTGPAETKYVVGRSLEVNGGRLVWSSGEIAVTAGAVFSTTSGGQINFAGSAGTTYLLSGSSGGSFTNSSSMLTLLGNGSTLRLTAPGSNTGNIAVGPGAKLSIEADFAHASNGTLSGSGTLVLAGGTQTFASNTPFTVASINFTGGVITGANAQTTFTINKPFNWSGGSWASPGSTIVTNAALNLTGPPGTKYVVGRPISLSGGSRLSWNDGEIQIGPGGSLTNSGGQIALSATGGPNYLISGTAGGSGTFTNAATAVAAISVPNGTTLRIDVPFTNNRGGITLGTNALLRVTARGSNSGTITVGTDATLSIETDFTHESGGNVTGNGTLLLAGGTQSLPSSASPTIAATNFTGGVITGPGNYSIGKTFNWSGGVWAGTGAITVLSTGTLNLPEPPSGRIELGRSLDNAGIVNWLSDGELAIGASRTFNNTGQLHLAVAACAITAAPGGKFNSGNITLPDRASLRIAAPGIAAGEIQVPAGSVLTFEADVTHSGTIAGDGTLNISAGTQTFLQAKIVAVKTVNLTGGAMSGPGAVTFIGKVNWLPSFPMTGGGRTIISTGSALNMPGSGSAGTGTYMLGRTLENNGAVNWDGGDVALVGSGTAAFNNSGTLLVGSTGGVGRTFALTAAAATAGFNNASAAAVVTVGSGVALSLHADGSNAGTVTLRPGASLLIDHDFTHVGGSRIKAVEGVTDASLVLGGGVHEFTGDVTFAVSAVAQGARLFVGGKLSLADSFALSNGELFVEPAGSVVPSAAFGVTASKVGGEGAIAAAEYLNADVLRLPDGAGVANFTGNYRQAPDAMLELRLDADPPHFEHVSVTGAVTLAGSLDLLLAAPQDFNPAPGTTFTILQNAGTDPIAGTFANYNEGARFPLGSAGRTFSITYRGGVGGNDVVLTALPDAPVMTSLTIGGGDGSMTQRSRVGSATLSFDAPVILGRGAVRLMRLNTDGSGADDGSAPTDASDAVSPVATSLDGGYTWVITFSAPASPFVQGDGLIDGVYQISLNPAQVTTGGAQMTASPTVTFHRLFGDVDGDGTVNNSDFAAFRNAFGRSTRQDGYDPTFDFDGNGTVNVLDYANFRKRFGIAFSY